MSEQQDSFDVVDVHVLAQRVAVLDETVALLTEYVTGPNVGGPWFWPELNETQRRTLLTQLAEFVEWLHHTYLAEIARYALPPCWWRHSDIREQLTALMISHRAVYTKKAKAVSGDLVDWHERALWPVLDRIQHNRTLDNCRDGNHGAYESRHRAHWSQEEELTAYLTPPVDSTEQGALDLDSTDLDQSPADPLEEHA